jgi:SEC-C motif-containing protein
MTQKTKDLPCPCGGGKFTQCCGRFLGHDENDAKERTVPQTAEQLMRSRYTAYTLRDESYLRSTWHASTRPPEAVTGEAGVKWLGLEVRAHAQEGDAATVEFVARYRIGGRAHRLHEISRFTREDGRWFYVDGSFPEGSR